MNLSSCILGNSTGFQPHKYLSIQQIEDDKFEIHISWVAPTNEMSLVIIEMNRKQFIGTLEKALKNVDVPYENRT